MLNESLITHLLILQKLFALVIPSPVGPAIVKVVEPSPPTPIPEYEGAFFTKIVHSKSFAIFDNLSTLSALLQYVYFHVLPYVHTLLPHQH